jgi:hypothetical protein
MMPGTPGNVQKCPQNVTMPSEAVQVGRCWLTVTESHACTRRHQYFALPPVSP